MKLSRANDKIDSAAANDFETELSTRQNWFRRAVKIFAKLSRANDKIDSAAAKAFVAKSRMTKLIQPHMKKFRLNDKIYSARQRKFLKLRRVNDKMIQQRRENFETESSK